MLSVADKYGGEWLFPSVRRWLENNQAGGSMIGDCLVVAMRKCGKFMWLKVDLIFDDMLGR